MLRALAGAAATAAGCGPRAPSGAARRRTVGLLSAVTLALAVGAAAAPDWVVGSVEIPVSGADGPTRGLRWHLGLTAVTAERRAAADTYSPAGLRSAQTWSRTTYVARMLAQSTYVDPGTRTACVRGESDRGSTTGANDWCGIYVANVNPRLDGTLGLFIFASLLAAAAWLLSWRALADVPTTPLDKRLLQVFCGLTAVSAAFLVLGIVIFSTAGISETFCRVLDPINLGDTLDTYCGLHSAYAVAVASAVFAAATAVLAWWWLPTES